MATGAELNSLYASLLGRAPDPSGISAYSKMDVNAARNSILGSPEYAQRQINLSNAPMDFARQSSAEMNALIERQNQQQQGMFNTYKQTIANQEKLPDIYTRLSGELGIPDLTKQAQGYKDEIYRVKGLLDRLSEGVTSRNIGTYATQALRDRIYASEGDVLRTDLGRLGTGLEPIADMLTSAQQQLTTVLPLHVQQQEKELKPLELEINSLSDRFSRELSGFSSNRELTFNALLDKIERERELSDREWTLAQQLAAEARQKKAAESQIASYLRANAPAAPGPAPAQQSTRQLPQLNNTPLPGLGMAAGGRGNIPIFNQGPPKSAQPGYDVLKVLNRR